MDPYQQYAIKWEEEKAVRRQKANRYATIISVASSTIGILLLAIGIGGYLANTEIAIDPDDFYGAIGWSGGLVLVFGNVVAALVKWP